MNMSCTRKEYLNSILESKISSFEYLRDTKSAREKMRLFLVIHSKKIDTYHMPGIVLAAGDISGGQDRPVHYSYTSYLSSDNKHTNLR